VFLCVFQRRFKQYGADGVRVGNRFSPAGNDLPLMKSYVFKEVKFSNKI
jgi:hypothetical protein